MCDHYVPVARFLSALRHSLSLRQSVSPTDRRDFFSDRHVKTQTEVRGGRVVLRQAGRHLWVTLGRDYDPRAPGPWHHPTWEMLYSVLLWSF